MNEFAWRTRVYWEDTDGGGVVYYANYLKFMERARTEWLRSLGHSQQEIAEQYGFVFAVAEAHVNYRKPARLDDELLDQLRAGARRAAPRSASDRRFIACRRDVPPRCSPKAKCAWSVSMRSPSGRGPCPISSNP